MAPTGLAYINLKNDIEIKYYNEQISGTCHKILYNTYENILKHRYKCNCSNSHCKYDLSFGLLIIDEVSMIDINLFRDILNLCHEFKCRLILLGDVNQLPSIGPGIILKKLINNNFNYDCSIKLNKIKRQNGGTLVECIKKMTTGTIIAFDDVERSDQFLLKNINDFTDDKTEKGISNLIRVHGLTKDNSKVITYFKSDRFHFNTNKINNILQNIYNPIKSNINDEIDHGNTFTNFKFRLDDKIIRTENDYSEVGMRANGEPAIITEFDGEIVKIKYVLDEIEEELTIKELYDNFELNYCITIHKSQGSQYDNVIVFIDPKNNGIMDKPAFYTAISRTKKKCIIVSNKEDFESVQRNTKNIDKKISVFMDESNDYDLE